jgi:hypothetical protein
MLSLLKKGCRSITLNVSGDSSTKYTIGAENVKNQTVNGDTNVTFKGLNPETNYIFKSLETVPPPPPPLKPGEVRIGSIQVTYRGRRVTSLQIMEIQLLKNNRPQNLGRDATQSTTAKDNRGKYMHAIHAVDGQTRFSSRNPTMSSTSRSKQSWWNLRIKTPVVATHLRIYGISPTTASVRLKDDRGRIIFSQMVGSSKTQTFKLK